MLYSKRGVSAVVATILIVMITVAAIGIIWVAILPMIRENLGVGNVCKDVDVSIVTSQGYTCYVPGNITLVQVNKGSSNLQVVGFKFYLSALGNSIAYEKDDVLSSNDYKVFYLNSSEFSEIEGISVVPIVQEGNSKTDCSRIDLKSVPVCSSGSVSIGNGPGQISPAEIIASSRSGSGSSPETENPPCVPDCACADSLSVLETCVDGCNGLCVGKKQDGSVIYPWGISSCEELQNISSNLTTNYALENDIDCINTSIPGASIWGASGFKPIGNSTLAYRFSGSLNGNNHTISALFINLPSKFYIGLFGFVTGNLSNIGLENLNITGGYYVGGLAGYSLGRIYNSHTIGTIYATNNIVGGLVGSLQGNINSSYSNVSLLGPQYYTCSYSYGSLNCVGGNSYGGLVGSSYGNISNSYSVGNVNSFGSTVGGFVGYSGGTISNSYSSGNVTGGRLYPNYATGGFAGELQQSNVSNCYSLGDVSGFQATGGFVGSSGQGIISNSYSLGDVINLNDSAGGFAGTLQGTINNSFSLGKVSSTETYLGGFVGLSSGTIKNSYWYNYSQNFACWNKYPGLQNNTGCNAITDIAYFYSLTNAPMNSWDVTVWNLSTGSYPKLKWQD